MDGVIIFADNDVFQENTFENQLFKKFQQEETYNVLPISSIVNLESTIKTISIFRAIILDWNFKKELDINDGEEDELEGVNLPNDTPENLLNNLNIYSLIYIYSQNNIEEATKESLKKRFGDKIQFNLKDSDKNGVENQYEKIKSDLKSFDDENPHMAIPFLWSQTINQSVQNIFCELESADSNWISEIRETSKQDGGEPNSEIIGIFQNILNESLIQNESLRNALDTYNPEKQVEGVNKGKDIAKLYRRIFYSTVNERSPLMTGEIFKFDDNNFGILISPECDLSKKTELEFLMVDKKQSEEFHDKKKKQYQKKSDKSALEIFNNPAISSHVLVSFPFKEEEYNSIGLIEFRQALKIITKNDDLTNTRIHLKLNAPYIQQLRQRYVSYFGRFGVSAIPTSLRKYNLS